MMKKYAFTGLCILLTLIAKGQALQELSLLEAYSLLEKQYPILQNSGLLDQIHEKEINGLDLSEKPIIQWNTDTRLQSQSTSLDAEGGMLPFEIDQPLFSLKTYFEANYLIMDGGINKAQRKLKAVQFDVDRQNLEVDRYALQNRINQLFIGINTSREQSKLLDISLQDLEIRKEHVSAGVEAGTILESEEIKIKVKILELKALQDNFSFRINGMIQSLAQLTGKELSENLKLNFPVMPNPLDVPAIKRPEQKLFQLQREAILAQSDLIETRKQPKLSAFAQAGVGYPNPLNILDNNIAPFGIIGARFSWQIVDWKKSKNDKEILSLQAQKLSNAQATLEFNLDAQKANYLAEIKRLHTQIKHDEAIAHLQSEVLNQLAAQLDEGVITSTEYLIQANAELSARQNLSIHKTELLKAQLNFLNNRGH